VTENSTSTEAGPEAVDDDALDDEVGGDLLVQEGDIAGDYLERLLDIVDADGDIDMDVENDRAIVAVVGDGLDALVGPNGAVLDALQELTRLAVVQQTGVRSRLMLDIGGWRAKRKTELTAVGTKAARRALESGEPVSLAPMTPFERKIVHDAVAGIAGVVSESEGVAPERRVVVVPDATATGSPAGAGDAAGPDADAPDADAPDADAPDTDAPDTPDSAGA
jgi:spoIIIJ-associated protein